MWEKNSNPLKLLPVKQCLFFFAYSKIRSKLFENLQNLKILVFSIILLNFIILYFPWNVHRSLLQEYHEGSNQGLFSSPRVGWYAPIDPSHKPGRQPSPYPAHSLSGNSWKNHSLFCKVIVAYINTMKTTFDFNFDLYQANKQDTRIHGNKEKLSIKKLLFDYLSTCNSKKKWKLK